MIDVVRSGSSGEPHARGLLAFLGVYGAVMMAFATATCGWYALHHDMTEAWAWGKEFQLGYSKHPPMMAWVAGAWFELMPRTNWSFQLLAVVNAAIGLAGVWMLAGLLLDTRGRWAAVLFMVLMPSFTLWALKYNANAILLSSWPWTAYFFLQSLRRPGVLYGLLAGLAGAIAILSKYYSAVLLVTLLGVALLHPNRRRYFRSATPCLSVAVGLAAVAPHLWWLVHADFPTFHYALTKTRAPAAEAAQHTALAILDSYLCLGLGAGAFAVAFGRRSWELLKRALDATNDRDSAWVIWLAHGPAVVTIAIFVVANGRFATEHLMPAFFAMPVAFLGVTRAEVTALAIKRIACVAAALWLPLTIGSPLLAAYGLETLEDGGEPRRQIAQAVTQTWHELFRRPLGVVGGSERVATAVTFYSPDAPSYLMIDAPSLTPWVSAERVRREGALIVCRAADRECLSDAKHTLGEHPFHKTLAFPSDIPGRAAPDHVFELFILTPAGARPSD
jgi:4-amino-4-deoxy-L-arabinose transferase-like glycosyltransferase